MIKPAPGTTGEPRSETTGETATPGGCALLALAFLTALVGPPLALRHGGPLAGGAAAVLAVAAWTRWGPPPMPGLLPGLLSTMLLCSNLAVLIAAGIAAGR